MKDLAMILAKFENPNFYFLLFTKLAMKNNQRKHLYRMIFYFHILGQKGDKYQFYSNIKCLARSNYQLQYFNWQKFQKHFNQRIKKIYNNIQLLRSSYQYSSTLFINLFICVQLLNIFIGFFIYIQDMISNKIHPYHLFSFKFAYVALATALAIYWTQFFTLPTRFFSHISIIWIMCIYRTSRKYNSSVLVQFCLAFWVKLGWSTSYQFYNAGQLYLNRDEFVNCLLQCFLATMIFSVLPLEWIQKIWETKYLRWFIYVIDQGINNGMKFHILFQTEFLMKEHQSILIPLFIILTLSITRPGSQILAALLEKNLQRTNLMRWIKIGVLNTCRALTLCLINYSCWKYTKESETLLENIQYFNICYYGMVGYLMYLESYTL